MLILLIFTSALHIMWRIVFQEIKGSNSFKSQPFTCTQNPLSTSLCETPHGYANFQEEEEAKAFLVHKYDFLQKLHKSVTVF